MMAETTYWPKAGSITEDIVLWFQENHDEFLHASDVALKWGIKADSVAPIMSRLLYYGLVKREKVDGLFRYSVGDKR